MLSTIIIFALVAIAIVLLAMWLSPAFKEKVATSWGAIGAALVALLAWIVSWFAGAPPEMPM